MQTKKKQIGAKTIEKKVTQGRPLSNAQGATRYQANPVVSCRVEGKDGAILFNADTDNTTLINTTGLFCWTCLEHPGTLEELVTQCVKNYAGVPDHAAVQKDIESFLLELVPEYILEV
jgi:hypothetical protein